MIVKLIIALYIFSLIMSYFLMRRNYIRTGSMPFPFILLGIIPLINTMLFMVMLWIEIEETVSYDKFLQLIFFNKKK